MWVTTPNGAVDLTGRSIYLSEETALPEGGVPLYGPIRFRSTGRACVVADSIPLTDYMPIDEAKLVLKSVLEALGAKDLLQMMTDALSWDRGDRRGDGTYHASSRW